MAADQPVSVGVLGGTGPQGRGLALRFAAAGHRVVLGSRDPARAAGTVATLRADHDLADDVPLTGAGNVEAATCDVVILAVPFDGVRPTLDAVGDALDGTILVSCVNRLGFDGGGPHPLPVEEGSAAELAATLVPAARVVGAFHHVPAGHLGRGLDPVDQDVLVTGDDDDACAVVCRLAEQIPGARSVRAGRLRVTRPVEEMTAVLVAINKRYRVTAGIRVAGLAVNIS